MKVTADAVSVAALEVMILFLSSLSPKKKDFFLVGRYCLYY